MDKSRHFDLQAIEKAGIDISMLPETSESGVLAGYYSGKIPVYSAIGDNQATVSKRTHCW